MIGSALYSIRSGIFETVEFFENRSDVVVFWGFSDSTDENMLNSLEAFYRIEYKVISLTYNTLQSSQPSYLRQLFTIQPPRSTRSSSTLTLLRPSVTSSLKFSNRSTAVAVPPLWNQLLQHCDKYLTHPTSSLKPLPLPSPHSSFPPN